MKASRMASLVAALAVTTWSCAGHVADTSIAPGDLVRITAPSMDMDESVGTVAALETDTLVVNTEERPDALAVPLADVTRLEVHRGKKSRVGEAAWIGGFAGALVGFVVGAAVSDPNVVGPTIGPSEPGVNMAGGALVGGGCGALLGAVIGAIAGSTDRWESVPLDRVRVTIVPQHRGALSVGLRVRL